MKKFLMAVLVLASSLAVQAGNDGGNGGDTYAKEFDLLGREIHKTFLANRNHPLLLKWRITPSAFLLAINSTLLRSAEGEDVTINGYEVDAINHTMGGEPLLINRTRWRTKNLMQKLDMVLHEYLGVLGIEIDNYRVSSEFSDLMITTYTRIRSNNRNPELDLYFGFQRISSHLSSTVICDETSDIFKAAKLLAEQQALSRCQMSKTRCSLAYTGWEAVISTRLVGYRSCEVTSIAR